MYVSLKTSVTLRISTHKALFFCVPNIFPPYSPPPPPTLKTLPSPLQEPSLESWPLPEPTPVQARVGFFEFY